MVILKFLKKGEKLSMDYISVQSWEDYRSSNLPQMKQFDIPYLLA